MKSIHFLTGAIAFFALCITITMLSAQVLPVKEWDKRFGGSGSDALYTIQQTTDGGYLLGGDSDSPAGGDKSQGSKGSTDFWIVKTNAAGTKDWDKSFGGNLAENMYALMQTSDSGFILGGESKSGIGGDKTQNGRITNKMLLVLAIATSNDAMAAGFSLTLLEVNPYTACLVIGAITFVFSVFDVFIGNRSGT